LNEAWFRAPDHPGIHSIPGRGLLCDVLSDLPAEAESESGEWEE
jgi:hypothetical protein